MLKWLLSVALLPVPFLFPAVTRSIIDATGIKDDKPKREPKNKIYDRDCGKDWDKWKFWTKKEFDKIWLRKREAEWARICSKRKELERKNRKYYR